MTDDEQTAAFDALVEYLRGTRGFDFSAYKRASLQRRVDKRLQSVNLQTYADYVDYLEVHPEEFEKLFNTILINVTEFFRDPPAWQVVSEAVLPRLLGAKTPGEAVRVWSAGCAGGQEAYSIAMLLGEALGEEQFRERVKIYATDVDEEALTAARAAAYTEAQTQSIARELRDKYFERANGRFSFRKDLRRAVIFGRHDLLQDAPISHVDLLICRNTLMYFNAEAQQRILSRFDFALNGTGYLFLGKAEVLLARSTAFVPLDIKCRVFTKALRPRAVGRALTGLELAGTNGLVAGAAENRLRELALEIDPTAEVVVDLDGWLMVCNAQARMLFSLRPEDIRTKLMDAQVFRPMDLRFTIEQVINERRMLQVKEVEWLSLGAEKRYLDVIVFPLLDEDGSPLGVKLLFEDVTRYRRLQDDLHHSHQELETANEELQSSNEELETTNEELQSTVEELETTNEELQSSNEELETMNEELQSTNEELGAANTELGQRGEELDKLNLFLESIMAGMRVGVVVLDHDLTVRAWNQRAEDLWGLRFDEARGQHFLSLDIGLPMDQLKPILRASLAANSKPAGHTVELTAINRRGKPITVRVNATRLVDKEALHGVILVMEELPTNGAGPGT